MSRFAQVDPTASEGDVLTSRLSSLSLNGRKQIKTNNVYGCDIPAILFSMYSEQGEHLFCSFSGAYLKYRQVVAEWMVDVADFFDLHPTTTHAAIAYLDRLQPNEKFSRFEWQMLAICCMLISSKYNECEEHVPGLHRLEEITQQTISNESVLSYELWALKRMGWKLNARTTVSFLSCYSALGVVFPSDIWHNTESENSDLSVSTKSSTKGTINKEDLRNKLERDMFSLATKCVLNVKFKPMQGSIVACAIVFYCRSKRGVIPAWRPELTTLTFHDPYSSQKVQAALCLLEPNHERTMPMRPLGEEAHSPATTVSASSSRASSATRQEDQRVGEAHTAENISPMTYVTPKKDGGYNSVQTTGESINPITPSDTVGAVKGAGREGQEHHISPTSIMNTDF